MREYPCLCKDCGVDVVSIREYCFVLRYDIWSSLCISNKLSLWNSISHVRFLCVGCIEKRLGRDLKPSNFDWINAPINGFRRFVKSTRLKDRMGLTNDFIRSARDRQAQKMYDANVCAIEKRKREKQSG